MNVVGRLLDLHPFRTLYVADLDAIEGRGDNVAAVRALRRRFPQLQLWVDAGLADTNAITAFRARDLGVPVLGSESLADCGPVMHATRYTRDVILSLDFKGDGFLGPANLIDNPELWPNRVIVMSLDRVGTGRGPDLDRLRTLRAAAPQKHLYAAGGARDQADLERLDSLGVAGVLLATALRSRRLPSSILARYGVTDPEKKC